MNYSLFGGRITDGQVVTYNDDLGDIIAANTEISIQLWGNVNRLLLNRGEGYRVARSFEAPIGNNRIAAFLELEGFEGISWPINMFRRGGVVRSEPFAVGPDLTATEVVARVGGRNPRQVPFDPWMMFRENPHAAEGRQGLDVMIPPRAMTRVDLEFNVPTTSKKPEPTLKYGVDYS